MQLLLGVVLGGLVSWFISRWYYKASGRDLERELSKQTRELNSAATLTSFERKLTSEFWANEHVGNDEYWVCKSDRTYQLKLGDDHRSFKEPWTAYFPDPYTKMFHIHLQVKGVTIKSIPFISADGERYILPLPKQAITNGQRLFSWAPDTIEYKIAEIIGCFYRENNLRDVANLLGIEVAIERHAR